MEAIKPDLVRIGNKGLLETGQVMSIRNPAEEEAPEVVEESNEESQPAIGREPVEDVEEGEIDSKVPPGAQENMRNFRKSGILEGLGVDYNQDI